MKLAAEPIKSAGKCLLRSEKWTWMLALERPRYNKRIFLLQTMLAMLWDHKNVTWHGFVSSTITFCNYLSTWNHIWCLYYWVSSIYSLKVFRDKLFEPKLLKAIASSLPTDISSGPWKLDGEIKMMQKLHLCGKPTKTKIQSNIKINTTILYKPAECFSTESKKSDRDHTGEPQQTHSATGLTKLVKIIALVVKCVKQIWSICITLNHRVMILIATGV